MQIDSFIEIFDTVNFSNDEPVFPVGKLFDYQPFLSPEALHYHNFIEIGYCVRGSGVFIVDGDVIAFSGKCTSIIYEGQAHIAQSIDKEMSHWHFLYINLDCLYSGHHSWGLNVLDLLKREHYDFRNLVSYDENPELFEMVKLILAEASEVKANYLEVIRGLVYALLLSHNRSTRPKTKSTTHAGRVRPLHDIADAINYINIHFMQDINIDTLTKVSNSSKASLQRKFHAAIGMSPMQYLHHLRLNRASVMLSDTKKSIAEIAMDVGYNSLSSFNRHFQAMYNMSPSSWRKR